MPLRLPRLLPARPQRADTAATANPAHWPSSSLRLLSFNMQAGMGIHAPHHYLTRGHRHLLPHRHAKEHLDTIAHLLRQYDFIALQEVDGGSLRSGYTHQLLHLAEQAGFPWWYQQLNRNLGHLGQFSNGLLSRQAPWSVESYTLPGWKGRGVIVSRFGSQENPLLILNIHLALSTKGRRQQLQFIHQLLGDAKHAVLMGDLNCRVEELQKSPLGERDWHWPSQTIATYPSWKPSRQIDHILVSASLPSPLIHAIDTRLSDHLPLAVELALPSGLYIPPQGLALPDYLR
jgi:endonuclease/exonuclease/phosphatase family metal-dependent hydrolase